jgi:S-adenosylmethionine decarboxylase
MQHIIAIGIHTLIDLYGCDAERLNDAGTIRDVMIEAARRAGATIVAEAFQSFSPQGVTGVVILAESHLAIHTWPERRYAAIDLFTCGKNMNIESCFSYLVEELRAASHHTTTVARGADAPRGATA